MGAGVEVASHLLMLLWRLLKLPKKSNKEDEFDEKI
jgi:hypothetical protein